MGLKKPKRLKTFQTKSHVRAPKQESETAKKIGGRVVRGSGCGYEKGDARLEGVMRIECKTTSKKSFSVTREILKKIEDAAMGAGEIPVLEVEFTENGKPVGSVCIVPSWTLESLVKNETDER